MTYELEHIVLRSFFDAVVATGPHDVAISDSKMVKTTSSKLKAALKDVQHKCTCARRTWGGPCEVCQASEQRDLYYLRNFFRVMRDAKKNEMSATDIQSFIESTKSDVK